MAMITFEQKAEFAEFLYREARLLDNHDLETWLALFTDDAEYIIPLREQLMGEVQPPGHPIVKDDKMMLLARVRKDETGMSHVEIPRSMTTHLVSNVIVDEGGKPDEFIVSSNFVVRQARKLRDEAWWVGRRTDTLRRVDGGLKIARREVVLDATVLPRGISIFF
jgi:3-phenylpropionate/cinnamic acid dioxygenase small subunit